jgi:hypothetical protein
MGTIFIEDKRGLHVIIMFIIFIATLQWFIIIMFTKLLMIKLIKL